MAHAQLSRADTGFSATPSTPNTSSTLERKELESVWKDLQEQVIKLAGGTRSGLRILSIDDVLNTLDTLSKEKAAKEAADKFGRLKDVTRTTLQCIQTIGGMIAEGASEVFGPSQMCFNALTFVLASWSAYAGLASNLTELLEKCAEFLERLTYYKDEMDAKLACLACQNLRLFVEICSRIIALRKRHARLFAFTKQLFLNDNSIQDVLDMMSRLNAKESLLVNAQTWRIVQDSSGKLNVLLEGQRKQRRDEEMKEWRRTIVARLGFPESSLGSNREPLPLWRNAYDRRKNGLVEGTGDWIAKNAQFVDWLSSEDPRHYMLVIQGDSNSGKTSLLANILRNVLTSDQPGPTSRAVCAYYFPEADRRKEDDEGGTILEVISRTLLFQIGTAYEAMTKRFISILESRADFQNVRDQWQRLFNDSRERLSPDSTFYLFLDGVDEHISEIIPLLQTLSAVTDNKKIRILLNARPETVSNYLLRSPGLDFATIPIREFNDDDVTKYIIHHMDNNLPITRAPQDRPGVNSWRATILSALKRACKGDFIKLNNSLKELSVVDLVDDIMAILEKAGQTRDDLIRAEIRRLNEMRTPAEISEINEIIYWIEDGRQWFSADQLEALLSIKYRRARGISGSVSPRPFNDSRFVPSPKVYTQSPKLSAFGAGQGLGIASPVDEPSRSSSPIRSVQPKFGISLLPFSQRLAEKYGLFRIGDAGNIDWKSSEYVALVPKHDGLPTNATEQRGQVIQAEVDIVRHFLSTVCPPDLYDRFEFERFFEEKSGGSRECVHFDKSNSDLRIAITCLTILTEPEMKLEVDLRYYAIWWLLDHMKATDLSRAHRELKASAGALLFKFFTSDSAIDMFFWPVDLNVSMETWKNGEGMTLRDGRAEWLYPLHNHGMDEVSRWFRDSYVSSAITTSTGEEFVSAVRNAEPKDLHKIVLAPVARRMAEHIYRGRASFTKRQILAGHWVIRGFLARCDERAQNMSDDRHDYLNEESDIFAAFEGEVFPLKDVLEIEAWCAKTLQSHNDDAKQKSLWEIHAALAIFQLTQGNAELYQQRARTAVQLNPQNWHACHFLASQEGTSNKEAISLLSRAKKDMDHARSRNPSWLEDHANSSLLARITLELGDRLWDSGEDQASAAQLHRQALQWDYTHFRDYVTILENYQQRAAWGEIISFIEALCQTKLLWEAWYDELVNEFMVALARPSGNFLAQAAEETGRWDAVEEFFTISRDTGAKRGAANLLFVVQDSWAKTLEASPGDQHKCRILSIRREALALVKQNPDDDLDSVSAMTDSLAQAYLELALAPDTTAADADKYGEYLADLAPDIDHHYDIWSTIIPVCALLRFHAKRGTQTKLSTYWLHRVLRASLEWLSDEDDDNDDVAYWILSRLLITVGDRENARIVYNLRNWLQMQALQAWEHWKFERWHSSELPSQAHSEPAAYSRESTLSEDGFESFLLRRRRTDFDARGANGTAIAEHARADPRRQFPTRTNTNNSSMSSSSASTPLTVSRRTSAPAQGLLHVDTDSSMPRVPGTPETATALDNDGSQYTGPIKPDWFVDCAACDKKYIVTDSEVLHACADCCGVTKLCEACYTLLRKGDLPKTKTMRCDPAHELFAIPRWVQSVYIGMPRGSVPLPDIKGEAGEQRWITLEEWKRKLRKKYLGEDRRSYVLASPTSPVHTR
ncbi:hypothetical protein Micbo1qcDRAFT_230007 [Microdochium bolleyi]|uniref:NACHT domain-containing protein n=1 Tax=Microdochium bolleyi TaxID=196109 RepID=A0A136JJI6_9PEZI|nr:hypothetical protein Micbo1qcDRAFT_230007 [Microdochium bolleyi]